MARAAATACSGKDAAELTTHRWTANKFREDREPTAGICGTPNSREYFSRVFSNITKAEKGLTATSDSARSNGGAAALDALARRFRDPLLRYYSRKVRTPEDAEELAQEVFLRLLKRADLGEIANIEGFVFVVAANLLKDYYRDRARHGGSKLTSLDNLQLKSAERSPGEIIEGRDDVGVLLRSIEELPPKCRAVFVLYRFEEVPHAEIARRMGITISMVEKHIAAALVQLKRKLKAAGDDKATTHD